MFEIKQYGLQRSGTNFLRVILQENYDVTVLSDAGGWKHGHYRLPQLTGKELDCVLCVKNPYAWLPSFHKWHHKHEPKPFRDFVFDSLVVKGKDEADVYEAANPVQYWNKMNLHWLNMPLKSHKLFVYRYEDVLHEPKAAVAEIAKTLQLQRKRSLLLSVAKVLHVAETDEPEFFVPQVKLGAFGEKYKTKKLHKGEKFDADFYENQSYLQQYDKEMLDFVKANLDPALMDRLGYQHPN